MWLVPSRLTTQAESPRLVPELAARVVLVEVRFLSLAQKAEGVTRSHRPQAEIVCVFLPVPFLLPFHFHFRCRDVVLIQS